MKLIKLPKKEVSTSVTRDVGGEGVQQALLNLFSGSKVRVDLKNKRKHPGEPLIEIDTRNILLIASGSFVGLEEIVMDRLKSVSNGEINEENIDRKTLYENITQTDLINFGFIPELVGRFNYVIPFFPLSEQELFKILAESESSPVKKYINIFKELGIDLVITDDFLKSVAKIACAKEVGARGLSQIINKYFVDLLYDAGSLGGEIQEIVVETDLINTPEVEPKMFDKKRETCFSEKRSGIY